MCTMRDRFIRKDDLSNSHVIQGTEKSSCCKFRDKDESHTAEVYQADFSHVLTPPLSPLPKAGLRVEAWFGLLVVLRKLRSQRMVSAGILWSPELFLSECQWSDVDSVLL